jgi:hypothetical protein
LGFFLARNLLARQTGQPYVAGMPTYHTLGILMFAFNKLTNMQSPDTSFMQQNVA